MLSTEAVPITFFPTPGALIEYSPLAPALPAEFTTTTPWLIRLSAARARG